MSAWSAGAMIWECSMRRRRWFFCICAIQAVCVVRRISGDETRLACGHEEARTREKARMAAWQARSPMAWMLTW